MKKFSLILAAILLTVSTSVFAQTKKVFAHYMVCYPAYNGSVEGFKHDIQDAQSFGIDGFALNSGAWDANYQRSVARMFQAAEELGTGFKLFISADRCCAMPDDQIIDMVATYAKRPNYFTYNGKAFFSAWSGATAKAIASTENIVNSLKAKGINVYTIPFMYTTDSRENPTYDQALQSYNAAWKKVCDGYFYFGAVGVPDKSNHSSVLNSGEALAKVFHDNGKTFMASVSPEYWGDKQPTVGRRYYEYNGGEGLAAQWQSIINVQKPEWVELSTWNDWTEGTYFSPITNIAQYLPTLKTISTESNFFESHAGFSELNKYYIQWYKTGRKPYIAKDEVFFFYRVQSQAAVTNDLKGRVSSRSGDVNDQIYITTLLTAPAQLQVTSGGVSSVYNLKAGLVNLRSKFNTGPQSFKLLRDGKTVLTAQGEDIQANPQSYNFNEYSGFAAR